MKKCLCILLAATMLLCGVSCATQVPSTSDTSKSVSDSSVPPIEGDSESMQPISEPVTITAWYTFGNTNEENFLAAIKDFNESQDYIEVLATQQTWNEITPKIMAALTANTQPDLIFCSAAADVSNYVDMNVAVDLRPYVEDENIGIPDFFEDFNKSAVDESTQWDGHMYMFPLSRTGEVMYYNADFFEEHSLSTPATWEGLRALCAQIHEITGGEALGSDYLDENYVDMVMQMGGSFIDYESKTACFDSEESRATLQYLKDLESNGYLRLKGDDTSLLSPFSAGLIPMVLGSSANYAKIFSQYGAEFNVGVCPIPVMENAEKDYVTMWGVNAVVLKSDKLRQQAAYEFLKFWTSKDYQATWAAGYDAMPVRTSAIETSAYQEYLKTALSTAVIVDGYDRLGFLPAGTGVSDTTNAITACIDEILLGTLSIDDAIVQYKADADAALQQ
ncbi:ABC transporter substrate-binding protein [Ruthenibacterium lactatiformans]|uniref:ABC transporter substrate-binding protein n=1 Tax=Ruthenibacterium lactatiformans TaxID=1550024 RepID=UPI00196850A8|nr:ABC transporter substrate-binding protein [Ruthenibacterium lactatiformans]MBN3010044.1 ABC transporter substrate-binding protein [Ruthenibacterium lactatiformans]